MPTTSRTFYRALEPDAWRNLAIEETLMMQAGKDECRLFLWQSTPCVVIGKNQNPWLECRVDLLEHDGVRLARRLSGGGAVYHDLGNLNFAFFLERSRYNRAELTAIILRGLNSLGIPAEAGERDIIRVADRKISGNAFCYKRNRVLHHGTLLIDADLDALHRYLKPMCPGIESRGIASVPSPVMNLRDHTPGLTVEDVAAAIEEAFAPTQTADPPLPAALPEKYGSDDWLFGRTPRFTCSGESAGIAFTAIVTNATIAEITTAPTAPEFEREFTGMPFCEFLLSNPQLKVS